MLYYIDFRFVSRKKYCVFKYIIYILRFVIYINLYTEINSLIIDCIRNVLRLSYNITSIYITSISYYFIYVYMLYYIDFRFVSRKKYCVFKYIIYILRFVIYINLYTGDGRSAFVSRGGVEEIFDDPSETSIKGLEKKF